MPPRDTTTERNQAINILIINPPFYRFQGTTLVHYPQGCCYVAGALEKAGFSPRIYNADFDPDKKTIIGNTNHINVKALTRQAEDYNRRLHDDNDPVWREIKTYLKEKAPDVLIVSVFNTTITAGLHIAALAKEMNPKVITIFEGSGNRGLHCAIDPSLEIENPAMDYALQREPEQTAVELMQVLAGNDEGREEKLANIKGLTWKRADGAPARNEERPPLEDLDSLPFPARHLMDGVDKMPPHTFLSIYGSRGCPFDCVFCGIHNSWGKKVRLRSPANMVDEIEKVYKTYGTRYYYLCDDIFFIQKERAREFCRRLIDKKLPVYWSAQTRAEMVDDETLELMKKAGGQHVAVGVEVGNQKVRDLIKKGNSVDDVRHAAKLIKKHGLYMVAFCIIGLPWEGPEEIRQTVELVKEIDPYIVFPYLPTPADGTEMAEEMKRKNPEGYQQFRDTFHMSTAATSAGDQRQAERQKVVEEAMEELVALNKKSLLHDVVKRPGFYWALANDMELLKKPQFLYHYFMDYAISQ